MTKVKAIIIEDEAPARDLIKAWLRDFPDIDLVDECPDGFTGLKSVNDNKPDIIFLDIRIPKINGFEMLELLDHTPVIIFTTAYDQYAIRAFEHNTADYLLKPFSKDRFSEAVKKAAERLGDLSKEKDNVKRIIEHIDEETEKISRVVIKDRSKINIVPVEDIIYIDSQDDYVEIHTPDGRYLKQKTMKYFEKNLDPLIFVRIHRCHIVRVDQIVRLEQYEKESYIAILKNDTKLKVSKSGYKRLKEILDI